MDLPARYILQEARCADIIVSGGPSEALSDPFTIATPKDLVMQAGRPLLVVPDATEWLDLRSILVAWKDTLEARRATADSLPMLRKAKDVTVAEILEEGDSQPAAVSRLRDVVAWLSRHGVAASELVSETDQDRDAPARLDCHGRRGRCGTCRGRCLWPFAVSRNDPRRHDPASDYAIRALRAVVSLADRYCTTN